MTIFKRTHCLVGSESREDILETLIHYMTNKINYDSRNMVNAVYSYEDIRSELYVKILSLVDTIFLRGWNKGKKISDILFFCARCLTNHSNSLRKKFAINVDYSMNGARLQDLVDSENKKDDMYSVAPSEDSKEETIVEEDGVSNVLLWFLSHGLLEEYVVLKMLLDPPEDIKTLSVNNVCKYIGIIKKRDQEDIKVNILIRLYQYGIILKDQLPKGINLYSYGIID